MRIGLLEREERMRDVKLHKGVVFEGEGERKDETLRINEIEIIENIYLVQSSEERNCNDSDAHR